MIENYKREEITIDMAKAQLRAIVYVLLFLLIFGIPYFFLWGRSTARSYTTLLSNLGAYKYLIALGVIVLGAAVHELIHGITWALFAKTGFKSIRFGVAWKHFSPYCHCNEPLLLKHYIIGGLMPGIVLGIIPATLAVVTGNIQLFLFGMMFTSAAGGDFTMVNILRKEPMNYLVQDHPTKLGCFIYRPV